MYMEMTTEEDKKIAEGWKADLTEFLSLTFIGGVLWVMSVTKPTGHRQLLFLKHLPEYCRPQYFEFPPFFPPSFSPPNYTVWVNALCGREDTSGHPATSQTTQANPDPHSIPLDRAESQSQYDAVLSARSEAPIGALLG
ncbi:hypothetical protein EI94DRAFT_1706025 [Lactarius quietus]|nr:hypothetical protein EI94DRAFT_1706025 [Lactarius quietus]